MANMSIIEEYPLAPLKRDFRYAKINRRESPGMVFSRFWIRSPWLNAALRPFFEGFNWAS